MLLRDELRRRDFPDTLLLFQELSDREPGDAELLFYRGEVHRLRRQGGDTDKAIALYRDAVSSPGCPSEAYRSLGMVLQAEGEISEAREAYRTYLDLNPTAEDAEMIRSYIRQLE